LGDVFAVTQAADLLPKQALQALLALEEWQLSGALPVQEHEIEGEEHELIGLALIHRGLESAEHGHAIGIEGAQLAVEIADLTLSEPRASIVRR
jgi:hypothetical protein